MITRKSSCIVVFVMVFMAACNDADQNNQPEPRDSDTASISPGERFPLTLTVTELHDDAVFNDGTIPASWINAGVKDSVSMKMFIRRLQRWVDQNQVDSIAAHMNFPMKNPGITDAREFKLNYSNYFSDGVKSALADQPLNQVFRNQQGVMIGQGQIWLRENNNNIQIFAINN